MVRRCILQLEPSQDPPNVCSTSGCITSGTTSVCTWLDGRMSAQRNMKRRTPSRRATTAESDRKMVRARWLGLRRVRCAHWRWSALQYLEVPMAAPA